MPQDEIQAIKSDFRNFLYLIWKHLNLPDPTPIQYDIADFLQSGEKRLVIEAFRGVGKSWITSAYVIWLLFRDPQLNILVVSASKQRADDFSTFTLRLLQEVPFLQHLQPQESQRSSKIAFDVGPARASHAPSVKSVGITGQITGSRADVIVADDVEVVQNSLTQMLRERLSESIKEFEAVLKPQSPHGQIIFLGTPQTEQSLYNTLPERGYTVRIWPARFPKADKITSYDGRLAPIIYDPLERSLSEAYQEGRESTLVTRLTQDSESLSSASDLSLPASLEGLPTDPGRFSEEDLTEREISYGRSGFALQFMLDTSLSDAERYPLKLADLVVMDLDVNVGPEKVVWGTSPELIMRHLPNVGFAGDRYHRPQHTGGDFIEYQGSVMAIDPSGRGGDETAYAIVKMLNGQLFLTAAGGFLGGYEQETLEALAKRAKHHKVNYVVVESNFGDGMFTRLLTPVFQSIYPCTIEEVRHTGQKELRIIDTLEPVMNQHLLVVDSRVIQRDEATRMELSPTENLQYQLFHQMTRLTKDRGCLKHDDRLEALSMAVNYWVERMGHDIEGDMQARREELLDLELERFIDNYDQVWGGQNQDNWLGEWSA